MNTAAAPTVKDQELMPFGLVESAGVNAFADFVPSKLNETESNEVMAKNDFINIFICHLIFYVVFCISLVLHILIDLGLGSFVKNQFLQLIKNPKNNVVENSPAFA
ncbi:hypothetical protein DNJ72_05675 [Prochlorococcus marinus XMU1403]|nr:hypothetical protein [Prochlorococcus marinus]MBW3049594.1 hypothetical protein [Prochlorococcus marinus str. MU1403]PYE01832.1 hypothetical protein DNJ72_05675 [Prochlorococcus marinus XMU1403]